MKTIISWLLIPGVLLCATIACSDDEEMSGPGGNAGASGSGASGGTGATGGSGGSAGSSGAAGSGAGGTAGSAGSAGSSGCSASNPGPSGCWLPISDSGAPGERRDFGVWAGDRFVVWGGIHLDPTQGTLDDGAAYSPATDTWQPLAQAPIWGRSSHVGVWTGTELLLWAGGGEEGDFQGNWVQGGRYRPDTDTWSTMTVTDVPPGRGGATAVWTGTHMLVWGGTNEFSIDGAQDGGAYDPATDTWKALSTTGAPTGRTQHIAVWTGTEMIVWGGFDITSDIDSDASTGGRYNPSTDSWTATAEPSALVGRRDHSGLWTGTELIVWGGISGEDVNDDGARYDPSTDTWTPIPAATNEPSSRHQHAAVWTGSRMIVWGGTASADPLLSPLGDGAIYDPATDTWIAMETSGAPAPRFAAIAVWTGDALIVWGGADGTNPALQSGGVYFPPL